MTYKNTTDLCKYLDSLLVSYDKGEMPNTAARIRTSIIREMLNTKKIEIVATTVGTISPVKLVA